jgi:hypothetical protein
MFKNAIRVFIALTLLTLCTASAQHAPVLTDGGSPMPMCPLSNPDCIVSY